MLGTIRDQVAVIIVSIVLLCGALIFFALTLKAQPLMVENFNSGLQAFNECTTRDYPEEYLNYSNLEISLLDETTLRDFRDELDAEETCSSNFVASTDDQIRQYVELSYPLIQDMTEIDIKLLDAVYSAPSQYYAYKQVPQDYLVFGLDEEETTLLAFVLTPDLAGNVEVEMVWSETEGSDLNKVQAYSDRLLVKYDQKIM